MPYVTRLHAKLLHSRQVQLFFQHITTFK